MKGLVYTTLLAVGVIIGHFSCKLGQVVKHTETEKRKRGGVLDE